MNNDPYRMRAAELRRLAEAAKSADVREQYLTMAADWERLADNADDLQRRFAAAKATERKSGKDD